MLEQQDLALINHTCSRGKRGGRYTPPLHTAREKQTDERKTRWRVQFQEKGQMKVGNGGSTAAPPPWL